MKNGNGMISRLFFSLLPVQIMVIAMGSINSIVDGAMAGRLIGAEAVGVIGLYCGMVWLLNAIGSVLLGGTAVLCGRYMGKGDLRKTEGVFSLNLTITFLIGAFLTLASVLCPGLIASILGANERLEADLITYIVGYGIGILPMLLAQQLAAFLQLERQNLIGYAGVAGMIISNVVSDYLFVSAFQMGIWGLALATTFSNIVYFVILLPYYFTSKAQLRYGIGRIAWSDFGDMIKIGFPGALLIFCLAFRNVAINRILLTYSGETGLSAMAAYGMVNGFFVAYCCGNGAVIRMLISVFSGEEDKFSMRRALRIVMTKGLLLSFVVSGVAALASPLITSFFFPDTATEVYGITNQLMIIMALCIPLILICQVITNYLQALDHRLYVNFISAFDGFFAMVIPSLILAPLFGVMGIWLANPIGIILTILMGPLYNLLYWKRLPKTVDEVMFIKPDYGIPADCLLDREIHDLAEVTEASEETQSFCKRNGMDGRHAYYAALCLEEMTANVIQHGFGHDSKKHYLSTTVFFKDGGITLRIKDDCIAFDPSELAKITSGDQSFSNIGIRMVYSIADSVEYRNMLGLNVLTLTIGDQKIFSEKIVDKAIYNIV